MNQFKGIEKLIIRTQTRSTLESIYNYDTSTLTISNYPTIKKESEYLSLRNNTISKFLREKAEVTLLLNDFPVELPKFEKIANYRPQAKSKTGGIFKGIQGVMEDGLLALGGNIMHQIIFWDCTKDEAQEKLQKLIDSFGEKYDFKLIKN